MSLRIDRQIDGPLQEQVRIQAAPGIIVDRPVTEVRHHRPTSLEVELPRDREDRVADHLGLDAATVRAAKEAVLRVGLHQRFVTLHRKAIGAAEHDGADQLLVAPALLHELCREGIEKFGMGRPFPLRAEVVHGADEPRPKEVHPDPVDGDPRL